MNDISIVGMGTVGSAISKSFEEKSIPHFCYDKYKGIGIRDNILPSRLIIACLPTPHLNGAMYDLTEIYDLMEFLEKNFYSGEVCIKSTLVPGTVKNLDSKFSFKIYHSPEFLSEKNSI